MSFFDIAYRDHLPSSRATPTLSVWLTAFLVACILALIPVLSVKFPPVSDYVNHLARSYLIANDGRDPALGQFYAIDWQLIPNLAMDLIVPPLAQILNIYIAGKVFLVLTMLILATGPHVIHYALYRRWSLGPLVATLFLYNGAFESGLVNYLFGIGVALFGIAAWIRLRQAPPLLRGAVSAGFIVALFLCHFSALGLYGIAVLGLELWHARAEPGSRRHWRASLAVFALPFLIVPVLAAAGPGGNDLLNGPIEWTLYDKLRGLFFMFESQSVSRIPDAVFAAVAIGLAFWAWRRGVVRLHPAGAIIALVGLVAFFVTPVRIMSAWGADVRQPLGYFFILIGFLDWRLPTARARNAAVLALLCLLVARIGVVDRAWASLRINSAEMARSLEFVDRGSKVLVAEVDAPAYPPGHTLHYLPCSAMIERSSLCSLAFSDPDQQVLTVKPPYRSIAGGFNDDPPKLHELAVPPIHSPETPSGRIYWVNWTKTYNYLYLLSTEPGARNPFPGVLTKIYEAPHFQLYAINK